MTLITRLRQLRHRPAATTGLQGHIDGVIGRELVGWARDPARPGPLTVGLFTPLGLVATTLANRDRADVRAAGFGDGQSGFAFPLDDDVLGAIARSGPRVEVRVLSREEPVLARTSLPRDFLHRVGVQMDARGDITPLDDPLLEKCRTRLFGELQIVRRRATDADSEPGQPAPVRDMALHQKLFARPQALPGKPAGLAAYLDYTRHRYRQDRVFDTDTLDGDQAHFLHWYLTNYGGLRKGRRVPLTRETIAWLNEPIVIGGLRHSLSRGLWWSLARDPGRLRHAELENEAWHLETLYWWAIHAAPQLGLEDCLVPAAMADRLRQEDVAHKDAPWPLSPFMHFFYRENPQLHFLDGQSDRERSLLTLSLMVMALRRPDLLRFLPGRALRQALTPGADGSPAPLSAFLAALLPDLDGLDFSRARYAAALRPLGFDLDSLSFLSVDGNGNRCHAAALPPVEDTAPVDVQLIGPIEKASGLGQATRLSATALETTGLSLNTVDFGLDNPAPEGFSSRVFHGGYRRARINLIHLNAESVPNAIAYAPDVFNGAYNIGYFFWELDSPATCHHLGMDLLDEIWVSSQYGVEIYQPHTDIPVSRVGMCFEDIDQPTRAAARDYVCRKLRIPDGNFIFLVAFDSFSFVQRKNPIGVLKAFQAAFAGVRDVRLVIKTQNRQNVPMENQKRIWRQVDEIISRDSRIHLLNETLPYDELIHLKKGSDAYISLHRSEGWGFGMIEAMNLGVPVVCTGYSGNLEFCSDDTAWLVDYTLIELEQDDYIFVRDGQKWAEPDIDDAARQMRALHDDPEARARKVATAREFVRENFSAKVIGQRYRARLDEILAKLKGTPI